MIYADNPEPCPVSVKIEFQLENLESSIGKKNICVLPPDSSRILISKLTSVRSGTYSFRISCQKNLGNHLLEDFEKLYPYYLPFQKEKSFVVSQGYFGLSSHHDEHALDFNLPVGTPICAAREGVIVKAVDMHSKHCPREECKAYNNHIIIYHPDGTFAEYAHLQHDGALVEVGDRIKTGQVIGLSGNTGWTTGPHLHFSVFLQKIDRRVTVSTQFKIKDGSETTELMEGNTYWRNYD
jgi:hypothetical protein